MLTKTKKAPANPLVKRRSPEERAKAIADGLSVSPIANNSQSYQAMTATHYPSQEQYITVTLDKLHPYEHNPRKTRNPNFDMIKESIRRRGLDHKPNITRRPGEAFYIIADGGNTRIQALKELFTETQDQRFWSISCHYKPWKGETADSVEAELDLLIGHLIENDTRADLSFIEKALGIQQAKTYYEQKLTKALSSRELSEYLENDGYIISFSLITKMERCIEYLYPHIPTVLFNGLGKPQIDKLLAIRNNALDVWQQYQFETDTDFNTIWDKSLTACNEDNPFQAKTFQDQLISLMVDTLGDSVSYEALFLEIDLGEQKFRKLAEKQQEIASKVEHSQINQERFQQTNTDLSKPSRAESIKTDIPTFIPASQALDDTLPDIPVSVVVSPISFMPQDTEDTDNTDDLSSDSLSDFASPTATESPLSNLGQDFFQNFGIAPGMSVQEQRENQAKANGLTFACTGRQPVADIWQVFPARKHKAEAYSLALDIAESMALEELVEHVVKSPVDYSYRMRPLDAELDDNAQAIYDLLDMLQTDDLNANDGSTLLSSELLLVLDDITLVKVFRLIRVVRYLRQHQGG
ncbi:ParB family protein [Pasteurella testudinis]|uniref:ParB family protein n=1 Tax=Pasteurella testudinis TaxID=761 RepID=UPI0040585FE9